MVGPTNFTLGSYGCRPTVVRRRTLLLRSLLSFRRSLQILKPSGLFLKAKLFLGSERERMKRGKKERRENFKRTDYKSPTRKGLSKARFRVSQIRHFKRSWQLSTELRRIKRRVKREKRGTRKKNVRKKKWYLMVRAVVYPRIFNRTQHSSLIYFKTLHSYIFNLVKLNLNKILIIRKTLLITKFLM